LARIESRMQSPNLWDDPEEARRLIQRMKHIKNLTGPVEQLHAALQDAQVLSELAEEENDEATRREVAEQVARLREELSKVELRSMLSDPDDVSNAFLSLHAGAGGTESCDWAEMLLRMYLRWAANQGYETRLLDSLPGEEAGIKNATVHVRGRWAYGYLKSEVGVHRLVRISPFDSGNRRHTSFAAVHVVPEIEEQTEIELKDNEIEMDFIRSSGPGGQHVNKTSSAVRLKHIPTGITVLCQSERSQHKNRKIALNLLKAKIYQHERQKREAESESLYNEKGEIAWGNQIRSYVLQPYQMVKDLRTGAETGDTGGVLNGDIVRFMEAYLRHRLEQKTAAAGDGAY